MLLPKVGYCYFSSRPLLLLIRDKKREDERIREWHEAKDRAGKGKVASIQVEL